MWPPVNMSIWEIHAISNYQLLHVSAKNFNACLLKYSVLLCLYTAERTDIMGLKVLNRQKISWGWAFCFYQELSCNFLLFLRPISTYQNLAHLSILAVITSKVFSDPLDPHQSPPILTTSWYSIKNLLWSAMNLQWTDTDCRNSSTFYYQILRLFRSNSIS